MQSFFRAFKHDSAIEFSHKEVNFIEKYFIQVA